MVGTGNEITVACMRGTKQYEPRHAAGEVRSPDPVPRGTTQVASRRAFCWTVSLNDSAQRNLFGCCGGPRLMFLIDSALPALSANAKTLPPSVLLRMMDCPTN